MFLQQLSSLRLLSSPGSRPSRQAFDSVSVLRLQAAVPRRRPGDLQREGVHLSELHPAAADQQSCSHPGRPQSVPLGCCRLPVSSSSPVCVPSVQTAAAAGRSSGTNSLWWRWTNTGTSAASSVKSATRSSTPSTSASRFLTNTMATRTAAREFPSQGTLCVIILQPTAKTAGCRRVVVTESTATIP